jgi:hypothetical protein
MHFNWNQFAESWLGKPNATIVKYEDLLDGAATALQPVVEKLTGNKADMRKLKEIEERFSFRSMAKREPGEEESRSFLRKGIAADWKNKFDKAACDAFDHYAGATLVRLGYEPDRSWVSGRHSRDDKESQKSA